MVLNSGNKTASPIASLKQLLKCHFDLSEGAITVKRCSSFSA
ncbi:MAG: Uncharacterised protein [Crocinitomicaceae bacterium]|nr:MAG: Uncharacterised protein [Crocinitomicaceae bacterium]